MVWWGFVASLRFGGCFHNFYEHKVSHNIERMFISWKKIANFLSKSCFLAKFNPSGKETCQKVWILLFVDLLKPYVLFVGGVKVWAPSIWNIEANFHSTKGFGVSKVTSFVHPFGIWVSTSMLISGGGASPPHWANNGFTCGCAKHIVILACPLPSYR
jgi:hypothetical protein